MVVGSQLSAQPAGPSIAHPRPRLGLGAHPGILILLVTMNSVGCGALSRLTLLMIQCHAVCWMCVWLSPLVINQADRMVSCSLSELLGDILSMCSRNS